MLKYIIRGLLFFAAHSDAVCAVIDEPARALRRLAAANRADADRAHKKADDARAKAGAHESEAARAEKVAARLLTLTA